MVDAPPPGAEAGDFSSVKNLSNNFFENYLREVSEEAAQAKCPVRWVVDGKWVPPYELAKIFGRAKRVPRKVANQDRMRIRSPSRQAVRDLERVVWWSETLR